MSNRTYYYIKPRPEAHINYGKVQPTAVAVLEAPVMPTPQIVAKPKAKLMDLDFVKEQKPIIARKEEEIAHSGSMAGWAKLAIMLVAVGGLYFGGIQIADAAVAVKGDITGLTNKGVADLQTAATLMGQKKFDQASDSFKSAEKYFDQAQEKVLDLGQTNLYLSNLGGSNFQITSGQRLIDAGVNLSQSGQLLISALTPALGYLDQVNGGTGDPQEYPKQIADLLTSQAPTIDGALARVSRANSLLDSVDTSRLDPDYAAAIEDAKNKTSDLKNLVEVLATVAKEMPRELGFNTPRVFTILNQNNNELRPTGGFLGSIANFKLYKGEIQDLSVDITQRIDGQNPNPSLSLPAPLQAVAWSGTWGTRDSNYYPNFANSANTFETLYEEASGGTSDMIIAINPTIIEDMLTIVGPIQLPGKDLTLDANNFVDLSQDQIEVKDHDKQNPKEIFNEFAPILMDKVMHANGDQLKQINAAFLHRLQTKDIMIYAKNKRMEEALGKLNFAGIAPTVSGDFLSVIRTNLGAKKSSQNVRQEIEHVASVSLDGKVEDSLKLTYTHQGTNTFPDGANKDYIRIYTPKGSELTNMAGFDPGSNFDVFEEDGRTVFGAWVTTLPGETNVLTVNYKPAIKVTGDNYQLYVSRQSGAGNTTLSSVLRLSAALQFDKTTLTRTKQIYLGKLETDLGLEQSFIRSM